jgi:hypothetical protein
MKLLSTFGLILLSTCLLGQVLNTFSRTYLDTMRLSSISGNCIELNSIYYCASSGYGLNLEQGSYCQVVGINTSGDVVYRSLNFTNQRTNWGGAPLGVTENNELVVALAQSHLNSYSPLGITVAALTPELDTVWSFRNADSTQSDLPIAMLVRDHKIYITGARNYLGTGDPYMFDGFLLILNDDGTFVDFKIYHEEFGDVYPMTIVPCADGGFFLGGTTNINATNEGYLIKTDSFGNKLSSRVYPNYYNAWMSFYNSDKLIISGTYYSGLVEHGLSSMIDTSGEIIWNKSYLYESVFDQYDATRAMNGDIISIGITTVADEGNSGYISRIDSTGEVLWQRRYNYNENTDFFTNVIETSDGGLLINGSADDGFEGGGQNLWLVKLDSMGCLEPNCWVGLESVEANKLGVSIFPNPANDWLNFKLQNTMQPVALELFSIAGQREMNTKLTAPLEAIQISHLSAGLYLAKFTLEDGRSVTERVVIAR